MNRLLRRRQLNNAILLWVMRASWGAICLQCFRQVLRLAAE